MSKLERFLAKPKTYIIQGEVLELKPLTVKSLPIIMRLGDNNPDVRSQATEDLIKQTLKDSIPDATDEEISNMSIENIPELLNAILDVNGFTEAEAKKLGLVKGS